MRDRTPDEDEWKKLRRLIGYLTLTVKLPLIIQADILILLKWWVDASYADHNNMWIHTGGTMSMVKYGIGSIISISKNQKLNTKSSTEAELIGRTVRSHRCYGQGTS